jgi:BCD family chlorophyll transporter-like MFS transporter
MNSAPKDQVGLALGTWGAVQATCASVAVALGGIVSDTVGTLAARGALGPGLSGENTGYVFVYGVEIVMLAATVVLMSGLVADRQGHVAAAGA